MSGVAPNRSLGPASLLERLSATALVPALAGVPRMTIFQKKGEHPTPPRALPGAPLIERIAAVVIMVYDPGAEDTALGTVVNATAGIVSLVASSTIYPVKWILEGEAADVDNVDRAIEELENAGYVVDVFASHHGEPSEYATILARTTLHLGDGTTWDTTSPHDFSRVRLLYTSACYGQGAVTDFLELGVSTVVATHGPNVVNVVHLPAFFAFWRAGLSAETCCTKANALVDAVAHAPLLGRAVRECVRHAVPLVDEEGRGLTGDALWEHAIADSRPHVFGDVGITIRSEPAAAARGTAAAEEEGS